MVNIGLYSQIELNRYFRTEKIVIFGDSITADNITEYYSDSINTPATYMILASRTKNHFGYINVLDAMMGGRLKFENANNLGIAGNTTAQMVNRLSTTITASNTGANTKVIPGLDTALAGGATLAFFLGGTNDINAATPNISSIKANIKTILDRIIANASVTNAGSQVGARVVVLPILPRQTWSTAASNAVAQANLVDINAYIRSYCFAKLREHVIFIESISKVFDAGYNPTGVYDPTIDYSLVNGTPTGVLANNNFLRDSTHPSQLGVLIMAKETQKLLQPIIGHANSSGEIWNRLDRTKQKLFNNHFVRDDGGTGAVTGIIHTGTLPSNWALSGSNFSAQGAHSLDFSRDPIDGKLIIDFQSFNGIAAGQQVSLSQIVTASNGAYAAGDNLQSFLDIEYLECTNAQAVFIRNVETATMTVNYYGNFAAVGALSLLDKSLKRGLWSTPEYVAGAGITQTQVIITSQLDSSAGKTARIKAKLHGVHFIKY